MSVLDPTTADLVDRQAILSLKLLHGYRLGLDTSHFEDEFKDIVDVLEGKTPPVSEVEALHNVHRQLWKEQEKLEGFKKLDDVNVYQVAYCAFEIRKLNRERARLKEAIDKATGEWRGQEKVYPQ